MSRLYEKSVLPGLLNQSASVDKALEILGEAYSLAGNLAHDPWQFAVELPSLIDAGVSRSVCRWLIAKGFAEHREESTAQLSGQRSFKAVPGLYMTGSSCFVITNAGITAQQSNARMELPTMSRVVTSLGEQTVSAAPIWNISLKELLLDNQIVKRFRLPAPNQELILQAFHEDGWIYQIDDPLPQHRDIPPKQRLHDTIKALNHNQVHRLIHFSGNGRGTGICWRAVSSDSDGGQ